MRDIPKLEILYLRHNLLLFVGTKAFAKLSMLNELDLSFINIKTLPIDWILPQNNLRVLHLQKNQFVGVIVI